VIVDSESEGNRYHEDCDATPFYGYSQTSTSAQILRRLACPVNTHGKTSRGVSLELTGRTKKNNYNSGTKGIISNNSN